MTTRTQMRAQSRELAQARAPPDSTAWWTDLAARWFHEHPTLSKHASCYHIEPWKVTLIDTGNDTMTGGRLKRVASYVQDDDAFCFTYGDGIADIDIIRCSMVIFVGSKRETRQ